MASTPPRWGDGVVSSYDAIAEQYAEQCFDELDGKPFDRDVLDRFARRNLPDSDTAPRNPRRADATVA